MFNRVFSRVLSATILISILFFASVGSNQAFTITRVLAETNTDYHLGGYADRTSVVQGQPIAFHIATDVSPFEVKITNAVEPDKVLTTIPNLNSLPQDCTNQYEQGCNWPATTTFTVPGDWSSGYYVVTFPTSKGDRHIIFVVRAANPGSTSKVVIISSTNTYTAYNAFGGKSVYDFNSTDKHRASHVSFNRPYDDNDGLGRFPFWELPFIQWMTKQQHPFEVITDTDMEDPSILSNYKMALIVGHSEYWTLNGRKTLEKFSTSGHHIAIFGGNTMWWQARYERDPQVNDVRTLVVYKDAHQDPDTGSQNALVSVNWFDSPVYNPENLITGASFRHAGYANRDADDDAYISIPVDQRTGFTVVDPSSWLLVGSNLKVGDLFGKAADGMEVDGALYNCSQNGAFAGLDGSDGTPLNFHVIATTPASFGHGTIGWYTNSRGGVVFNAGTRDWALGLGNDPTIDLITTHLLDKLSNGQLMAYDPVSTPLLTHEFFNCPQQQDTLTAQNGQGHIMLPGWSGVTGAAKLSAQCAYEGAAGLELDNHDPTMIARSFSPTNKLLNPVYTRLYINLDNIKWPTQTVFTLFTLDNRQESKTNRLAQIQVKATPQGNFVDLIQLDTNTKTQWASLSGGWQSLEIGWQSPGDITLWVNNKQASKLQNKTSGQGLTEMELTFPPTIAAPTGYLCVDGIVVSNTRTAPIKLDSNVVAK